MSTEVLVDGNEVQSMIFVMTSVDNINYEIVFCHIILIEAFVQDSGFVG
jgi:hypothetical protein